MSKKILSLLMVLVLAISLVACNSSNSDSSKKTDDAGKAGQDAGKQEEKDVQSTQGDFMATLVTDTGGIRAISRLIKVLMKVWKNLPMNLVQRLIICNQTLMLTIFQICQQLQNQVQI